MSQEKETKTLNTVKTKKRLIATIIRWFFAAVFAVLLIIGLLFHAPWKVLTILAIFLAALTVLPRPFRKYFWGCVGVVLIAIIIWVFLPDNNEDWRPYRFDKEIAALNAKYALPDEENAALIYEKLLTNYDPNGFIPPFFDEDMDSQVSQHSWKSEDYPELTKWFEDNNEIINTLLDATDKKQCMFPISADPFLEEQMDRYAAMRRLAKLIVISGNNDMGEGRYQYGCAKYIAVLKLGDQMSQQTTLLDKLVGMSIEALGISRMNLFVVEGEPAEEHLSQIDNALREIKHDWSLDFPKFIESDKLYLKNMVGMFYEIDPGGKTRLSHNPMAAMKTEFPDEFEFGYWKERLFKIGYLVGCFFLPGTPQEAGKIIDIAFEKAAAKDANELANQQKISFATYKLNFRYTAEMMANILLGGAYLQIPALYLKEMTEIKGSLLLIALRRFKNKNGSWPDNIVELDNLLSEDCLIDPSQ